jgi:hypothetical protein
MVTLKNLLTTDGKLPRNIKYQLGFSSRILLAVHDSCRNMRITHVSYNSDNGELRIKLQMYFVGMQYNQANPLHGFSFKYQLQTFPQKYTF